MSRASSTSRMCGLASSLIMIREQSGAFTGRTCKPGIAAKFQRRSAAYNLRRSRFVPRTVSRQPDRFPARQFDLGDIFMKPAPKSRCFLARRFSLADRVSRSRQMDGPPPPDGPMQGLMHRDRHGRPAACRIRPQPRRQDHPCRIQQRSRQPLCGRNARRQRDDAGPVPERCIWPDFQKHAAEMFQRDRLERRRPADARRICRAAACAFRDDGPRRCGHGDVQSCTPVFVRTAIPRAAQADEAATTDHRRFGGSHGGRGFGGFGLARFCGDARPNADGKVTRAEFDTVVAKEFQHGGERCADA